MKMRLNSQFVQNLQCTPVVKPVSFKALNPSQKIYKNVDTFEKAASEIVEKKVKKRGFLGFLKKLLESNPQSKWDYPGDATEYANRYIHPYL